MDSEPICSRSQQQNNDDDDVMKKLERRGDLVIGDLTPLINSLTTPLSTAVQGYPGRRTMRSRATDTQRVIFHKKEDHLISPEWPVLFDRTQNNNNDHHRWRSFAKIIFVTLSVSKWGPDE